jgi:ABC-type Fe3+ transport system permease subunit
MTISFTLDWTSFWLGAVATLLVMFVGIMIAAVGQYRKQKRGGLSRRV